MIVKFAHLICGFYHTRMFKYSLSFLLSFICLFVHGKELSQYIDLDDDAELSKILSSSVIGEWHEFSNKSLPFDKFVQKIGLQYLRLGETPFSGWYAQIDGNKKKRNLRHFNEGILEGQIISWRSNGSKFHQGNYQNGRKHGLFSYWSDEGVKITEQYYNQGKLNGISNRWYQNGKKQSEQIFQNGKIVSAIGWMPNGERCPSTKVINGAGMLVVYDSLGKGEARIITNEKKSVERYENGNIREEGYYKKDKKDGMWIYYRFDGAEHFRVFYRDGVRIRTKFSSSAFVY